MDTSTSGIPTAGTVVARRLSEQVAEVRRLEEAARADTPDSAHKMRVALRRLRSALATFRPVLDRESTDPLRDEIRWLARELGPVRDAEVLQHRLLVPARGEATGTNDAPATARIEEALREQREHARARVAATGPDRPADRARLLHEARKAAKRARYAGEALEGVCGADARRFVEVLTRVQSALGEYQDTVLARAILRHLAEQARQAGEDTAVYRALHAREERIAEAALAEFRSAWREAAKKRHRRWAR